VLRRRITFLHITDAAKSFCGPVGYIIHHCSLLLFDHWNLANRRRLQPRIMPSSESARNNIGLTSDNNDTINKLSRIYLMKMTKILSRSLYNGKCCGFPMHRCKIRMGRLHITDVSDTFISREHYIDALPCITVSRARRAWSTLFCRRAGFPLERNKWGSCR
jgi:hypothetical protein